MRYRCVSGVGAQGTVDKVGFDQDGNGYDDGIGQGIGGILWAGEEVG